MKIKTRIITLLAVLAILGTLLAVAAVPAYAAAGITPTPQQGKVGSPISIGAAGFAGLSPLSATFGGVPVTTTPATVTTLSDGSATFSIVVPARPAGNYTIAVTDGANVATNWFVVQPAVSITAPTSKQGPVGTTITVTGTGFTAGVTGFVKFENPGNGTLGSALIDSTGSFQIVGVVPASSAGAHKVWGVDLGSPPQTTYTLSAANNDSFNVTPTVAVSPSSGLPASIVNVTGSGWTYPGTVTLYLGGTAWTTTPVKADNTISASPQVLTTAATGINQVSAVEGLLSATATFTVQAAGLSVNPTSGPRGTTVLITGNAFKATPLADNVIAVGNLTFAGIKWATTAITIDTSGTMQPTTLAVFGNTSAALGVNQIVAGDKYGITALATFTVTKPTLTVNPTTGLKGSTVVVQGSGWVPGKVVNISLDAVLAASPVADSSGNIAATVIIAIDAAAGQHIFTAADAYSNNSDAVTFTVGGVGITVSPTSGVATTTVVLAGTGFGAYFPITVKIGAGATPYILTSQALSDANGAFTYTFTMPGLAPGVQVLQATDGSLTATTFFTIIPAPVSVGIQLAGISSQLVRVWGYTNGTWYLYDPADLAGSDLTTLVPGAGYWINANAACTLIYNIYSYSLNAGWNLVGWR
jgi:hypothetical protein